jgi:uncharacterized protein
MKTPWPLACLVSIQLAAALIMSGCDTRVAPQVPAAVPSLSEFDRIKQAAEKGDVQAQLALAERFDKGDGVPEDASQAFGWFLKAANAGDTNAMLEVSARYFTGNGVDKSEDKAKEWRRRAAEAGNAKAQRRMSIAHGFVFRRDVWIFGENAAELKDNAREFVEWLTKSSNNNHLPAKHDLAMVRLLGATSVPWSPRGAITAQVLIKPDIEAGLRLLEEAAEGGYWKSQWALAVIYQVGFSKIGRDRATSDRWWDALAKQDAADSQFEIGSHYEESDSRGYDPGRNRWRGRNLSFTETNRIAADWYEKAAAQGHTKAAYSLGALYMAGRGVAYKNELKAIELWRQAAEKGYPQARLDLGMAYLEGKGIPRDYARALELISAAAIREDFQESARARNAVGVIYEFGHGVESDLVMAYAWYNIAASSGYEKSKRNIARVEKKLGPNDIQEAQALTRDWKPGRPLVRASSPAAGTKQVTGRTLKHKASGTGFLVSRSGDLLTNYHVVADCAEIRIPIENKIVQLRVSDQANDLALLRLEGNHSTIAPIADPSSIRQGDEIVAFGFPLDGYLPASGNLTTGIVSALAGPGNNASLVQITAAVQLGSSGGPVFDKKGNVVAVVVGKADAIKIAKATGDIPQNINFAIAGSTVRAFLDGNNINYEKPKWWSLLNLSPADIAARAQIVSVKLECWR